MYRIRLHGRGGQGMKTASRILGTALFLEGFEVQDAPRYGAERRGAPIFAYVRAAREPIRERGLIHHPDLVATADESLVTVAQAGVLAGLGPDTILLINSEVSGETWRERLQTDARVLTLPVEADDVTELRFLGAACAAAAARCLGVVSWDSLGSAVEEELGEVGAETLDHNLARARDAWERMEPFSGCVKEGQSERADAYLSPDWIELPFQTAELSAPDIHAAGTSVQIKTGLWRSVRPVIDYERCNRCSWICSTHCPDSAIPVDADRTPRIDYDHCKGCLICVAVCPTHAIGSVPEPSAAGSTVEEGRT